MNESFLLRFRRGTKIWRLSDIGAAGIRFDEPDAAFRHVVLDFDGRSDAVKWRLDRIRSLHGWHPWEFKLLPFLIDGMLGFKGVGPDGLPDSEGLPPGHYTIKPRVEGLAIKATAFRFEIPANGSAVVDVPATRDDRRVKLALAGADAEIARLLDAHSPIDQAPTCRAWLAHQDPRPTRKACLLNILGQLRVTPNRTHPLIREVARILEVRDDRIYAEVTQALYEDVQAMAQDPSNQKFWAEGEPHAEIHLQLLDGLPAPYGRSTHRLESYRAEGSATQPALQAVFAIPIDAAVTDYYAEFDIDLGNPLQDVAGFAIHMGELADNKPTNHLDLRERLTRAKDFLYYTVSNA